MSNQLQRQQCKLHMLLCDYLCTYSKCGNIMICSKCKRDHLQKHPQQFIYQLEHLLEIHGFDKIKKLAEVIVKTKNKQDDSIYNIYKQFQGLSKPLERQINQFSSESKKIIKQQLDQVIKMNKEIVKIGMAKITKSQTQKIKGKPSLLLQQTIKQAQIVNNCEYQILNNFTGYKQYLQITTQMCTNLLAQLKSMMAVASKLIITSIKYQRGRYVKMMDQNHHEMSFYKRYNNSHEVAFDKNKLQSQMLAIRRQLECKDRDIVKSQTIIKQKVIKINQLQEKVADYQQQLLQWQQKKQRQQKQRLAVLTRQKKKKEQYLIKNGIIGSNNKTINLEKKQIEQQNIPLILQIVPNAIELDISSHKLKPNQLQAFLKWNNLQILRYNFNSCDKEYLMKAFSSYSNLIRLQLNSAMITDQLFIDIAPFIPSKLKILSLIDNNITDEALQQFFKVHAPLEVLIVSYNKLTSKSLEIIGKYSYEIKKLHIAKNKIGNKGAHYIGKYLKDVEELFLGSTGITKEGHLSISRNCFKLKRLSLVATQVSTQIISQILLGLKDLQWLDISYCNLNQFELEKVEKLKVFNKNLKIITNANTQ